MATEYTIDLKAVLAELDKGNLDYYQTLSDEQQQDIKPWVLMRFMSSSVTNPEYHILMVNDFGFLYGG